jgi:hypothetical protein
MLPLRKRVDWVNGDEFSPVPSNFKWGTGLNWNKNC